MLKSLLRTKPLHILLKEPETEGARLRRTLGPWDLTALGVGCIIGVGIFVLPGQEAAVHAGPGIILSFAIAALACACSALCYAELASSIPIAGSAYTYGYATLGEIFGWIIGWDLILEYVVGASLVSIGWSGYCVNFLNHALSPFGLEFPPLLAQSPWAEHRPGLINLPAVFIVLLLTALLVRGIQESSRVNKAVVALKIVVILVFIAIAVWHINPSNWKPFAPFGFGGIMTAAAVVFLAYVGFDAVSTAAEEAKNPQKDMPIGILASLAIATVLYMAVAAIMTGVVPYGEFKGVAEPVAKVLNVLEMPVASTLVSLGAIAGMTSVILVLLLGQPRIIFTMSRDGLLPPWLATVHPKYRTPHRSTLATGLAVAVAAGLTPIEVVAHLCSIGTLFAFLIVCAGVIVLRYIRPEMPRPFKVPLFPLLPAIGALLCGYLMLSLPREAWERFAIWLVLGILIYAGYGYKHSRLSGRGASPAA